MDQTGKSKRANGSRLSAEALAAVSGGFQESDESLSSFGNSIICPACGASKQRDIRAIGEESPLGMTGYRCAYCAGVFYVNGAGEHFSESEYDDLCRTHNASVRRGGI